MPDPAADKRAHLLLHGTSQPHAFTAHSPGGGKKKLPERDRQAHGQALRGQLQELEKAAETAAAAQNAASKDVGAAKARGDDAEFERLRALVDAPAGIVSV